MRRLVFGSPVGKKQSSERRLHAAVRVEVCENSQDQDPGGAGGDEPVTGWRPCVSRRRDCAGRCVSCVVRRGVSICACVWLQGERSAPVLPVRPRQAGESLAKGPRSSRTGKGLDNRAPGSER